MDYSGHDSNFDSNLVVVNAYDGQNCINGGGFPPGHRSNFTNNKCILAGCRGSPRSNLHGPCEEKIGNFGCDAENLNASMCGNFDIILALTCFSASPPPRAVRCTRYE